MQKNNYIKIIIVVASLFLLANCHGNKKTTKAQHTQTVVAKLETPVQKLYFSGTLSPIRTSAVVSTVAGNISEIDFSYGERIEANQQLLVIDSQPLSQDYRKAVSDFLQKKDAYITGVSTFKGTEALFKAGVIAQNEYVSDKTALENKTLDYLQSRYALEKVLRTANIDSKKIEALSLSDTQEVNALLETHFRNIVVKASSGGIALFPIQKSSGDDKSSSGKLMVGDTVKEGQLLLSIGDLTGLSATFDVSEINIDLIHKNMPVLVTGNAFPGKELTGVVTAVSAQANQGSGDSGLSMFTVAMKIPVVDKKIMENIRVGMTAKFEMDIKSSPRIMLPVNAVFEKNGESFVTIVENGADKIVPVVTGNTTPTQVVIISGIKVGDQVVVP